MQRPWRGAVYWLAPHGLFPLLSYTIQDHLPRDGSTEESQACERLCFKKRKNIEPEKWNLKLSSSLYMYTHMHMHVILTYTHAYAYMHTCTH